MPILRGRPGRGDGRQMCERGVRFPRCPGSTPGCAWWQEYISRVGTVGWVMRGPEVSPSSRDVVIACVVSSQKRGVDMTRGYYVSATIWRGCGFLWPRCAGDTQRGGFDPRPTQAQELADVPSVKSDGSKPIERHKLRLRRNGWVRRICEPITADMAP